MNDIVPSQITLYAARVLRLYVPLHFTDPPLGIVPYPASVVNGKRRGKAADIVERAEKEVAVSLHRFGRSEVDVIDTQLLRYDAHNSEADASRRL